MINNIFELALNITEPWFVKSIDFNEEKKRLDITLIFEEVLLFTMKILSKKLVVILRLTIL